MSNLLARRDRAALAAAALRRIPRLAIPVAVAVAFVLLAGGAYRDAEAADLLGGTHRWLGSFYRFGPDPADALHEAFFAFDHGRSHDAVPWTMQDELAGSPLVYGTLGLFGGLRNRWAVYAALGFRTLRSPRLGAMFSDQLQELLHADTPPFLPLPVF